MADEMPWLQEGQTIPVGDPPDAKWTELKTPIALEKRGLVYQKIPAIMQEVGWIGKHRQGPKYHFRGIDDIYYALQPLLAKHGCFIVPRVDEVKREERTSKNGGVMTVTVLTVTHRLYASDGSFVEGRTVGEAMDNSDKSCNKAMSVAMKYFCFETFAIPSEGGDDDTENENPEIIPQQKKMATPQQVLDLMFLCDSAKVSNRQQSLWMEAANVNRFEDMSEAAIVRCIQWCEAKLRAQGGEVPDEVPPDVAGKIGPTGKIDGEAMDDEGRIR